MDIIKTLFEMQDIEYKNFHSRLMPTVDPDSIIGIRIPILRKFAKEFSKSEESIEFLKSLPHKYYEENNLHAFLIENIKDYDKALYETEEFLPYIDNWATCDSFSPKVFKSNKDRLIKNIMLWINSDKTYTVRYAIGLLMNLYLDDDFKKKYMETVANVESTEYYVNMMRAWYFATALAKKYDIAIEYIKNKRLDKFTHNKAIQKAVESFRIDKDTKEYLKSFKIK